jgi:glycosyltransferase involved in cell wall biosynthesis
MACQTPVIAAGVGALKEMFINNPDWLYEPGCSSSLANALEKRLSDLTTNYPPPPSWMDLAKELETIMLEIVSFQPTKKGIKTH